MQFSLPLCVAIIVVSVGTKRTLSVELKPITCPTPGLFSRHGSFRNDNVQVIRFWVEKHRIFCSSAYPIKWIFGTNSTKMPSMKGLDWEIGSSDGRICLSLSLIEWSPSWNTSTLFVKCETNDRGIGSSRWYKVTGGGFEYQDHAFNPTVMSTSNGDSSLVPVTSVIAIVGGTAAFLILLLVLVVILLKKVKSQRKQIELTNDEIDEFMLGVAAEKAKAKGINGLFVLPYDPKFEVQKSDVIFRSNILGSGAFGQVVKGVYQGNEVAIKTVKTNVNNNAVHIKSLLGELKVMSYMGKHPNLVELVGAITANIKGGEVYLIFEYCSHGNAHKFVREHRNDFVDMLTTQAPPAAWRLKKVTGISKIHGTALRGGRLTTKDLVRWAYEVASGMDYVAGKNVYHGDLAARNILLKENMTAKVGDFGLSKQLDVEKYNCYVQKKECPLPLKWMAIESLRDLTFSIHSDVWSFGVTMWELFTLGAVPYPGMDWNFESWRLLREGKRLEKPEYASDSMYNIMMRCWNADPVGRPAFSKLRELLHSELEKL